MSTRPQIKPYIAINAQSMASNITQSQPTIISNLTLISYTFSWSGSSPVGTIAIQACNDAQFDGKGNYISGTGSWESLPLNLNGTVVTTIPVSGNTGNGVVDIDANGLYAIQAVYTASTGTGTLNATLVAKVA